MVTFPLWHSAVCGPEACHGLRTRGNRPQKTNFSAPCLMRGSAALKILPNVGLLMAVVGFPGFRRYRRF
ncbi:MAG: hypothetical protein C5B51_06130 [Terriglobia bacterium]|nr:MAG: hypothetical protein C5B51_06130 [Terriglobia bacterium]